MGVKNGNGGRGKKRGDSLAESSSFCPWADKEDAKGEEDSSSIQGCQQKEKEEEKVEHGEGQRLPLSIRLLEGDSTICCKSMWIHISVRPSGEFYHPGFSPGFSSAFGRRREGDSKRDESRLLLPSPFSQRGGVKEYCSERSGKRLWWKKRFRISGFFFRRPSVPVASWERRRPKALILFCRRLCCSSKRTWKRERKCYFFAALELNSKSSSALLLLLLSSKKFQGESLSDPMQVGWKEGMEWYLRLEGGGGNNLLKDVGCYSGCVLLFLLLLNSYPTPLLPKRRRGSRKLLMHALPLLV